MSQIPVKSRSRWSRAQRGGERRDLAALERRRTHAAELFEAGFIPAEIARRVGVRHQIVSEWRKAWCQGGREALRSGGPAGRKPRLTPEQRQLVNTRASQANDSTLDRRWSR